MRYFATWMLLLTILSLMLRTFCVQGLLAPVRVASGSMAEHWRGPHLAAACPACDWRFAAGLDALGAEEELLCPACGAPFPAADAPPAPGEAVVIDRTPFLFREPRRHEVVVFRQPRAEQRWAVKRLAGLPGEEVSLRGGDLWIGGEIDRKSYRQWRMVAIPVHDSRHCRSEGPSWREARTELPPSTNEGDASRWHVSNRGAFRFTPHGEEQPAGPSWLEYRHRPTYRRLANGAGNAPLFDHYGYNQGVSRQLHRVRDFGLETEAEIAPRATLWLSLRTAGRTWVAQLNAAEGTAELCDEQGPLTTAGWSRPTGAFRSALVYCDRRLWLAVGGKPLLEWYDTGAETPTDSASPTAEGEAWARVGGEGGTLTLTWLRIERDIHHLSPSGLSGDWPGRRLTQDEFLLLGDNAPLSLDGRHWPPNSVRRRDLVGRAYRWRPGF